MFSYYRKLLSFTFSLIIFFTHTAQARIGEKNANISRSIDHILAKKFASEWTKSLITGMKKYNENRTESGFILSVAENYPKELKNDLIEMSHGLGRYQLPKLKYQNGIFRTKILDNEITFTPEDVWKKQLKINDKVFKLSLKRGFKGVQQDLVLFFNQNKTTSFFQILIPDANAIACGGFCISMIALLIGSVGIGFWLKSDAEKREIAIETVEKTLEELRKLNSDCRRSARDESAYESIYNLWEEMETENYQDNSELKLTELFSRSIHGKVFYNESLDCRATIFEFMKQTYGSWVRALDDERDAICGNKLFDRVGLVDQLSQCFEAFTNRHEEITNHNRYITPRQETGSIKSFRTYQRTYSR